MYFIDQRQNYHDKNKIRRPGSSDTPEVVQSHSIQVSVLSMSSGIEKADTSVNRLFLGKTAQVAYFSNFLYILPI